MSDSAPAETAAATGVQLEIDGPTSQMPLLSLGKPETGNGLRLKKGTLWGPPDLNAKAGGKPGPPLGVQGRSFEGKDGASPASEGSRQSPRPPSSSPSLAAAARTGVRSPSKRESGGLQPTQNGHPPRSGGPVHLQARHSEISSVVLTLDSPVGGPIAHRRLQPSPHQLKQQALAAGRSQQQSPTKPSGPGGVRLFDGGAGPSGIGAPVGGPQSQVMRIDSSVPDGGGASGGYPRDLELPESIPPGGEDEIAWLRMRLTEGLSRNEQLVAQLQRVQQESLGLRSTLIAQQGAKPAAAAAADGAEDQLGSLGTGTPRGTKMSALQGGKGGKGGDGAKNRQQRKRAQQAREEVDNDDDADHEDEVVHVHAKSEELTRRILETLSKKPPFEGHDTSDLLQLVAAMAPVDVKAGVDVIKEGETGDLAYWVDTGSLAVVVGGDKEVDTITSDTVFGEVALVYDLERTATIRAKTDAQMWLLHRTMFQHILRDKAIADRKAKFTFLQSVKIFGTLSGRMISRVADVVEEIVLEANEAIIREGDEADSMYIIHEGQAVVSQKNCDGKGDDADDGNLLRVLKEGDYFGERALLFDERRSATVTAASKIRLMRLDKESFRTLLADLHAELLKRAPKDEHKKKPSPAPARPPAGARHGEPIVSSVVRPPGAGGDASGRHRLEGPKAASLKMIKMLGSGGYGRVSLVRDTKTKRVYALKRVCRAHLLAHNGMMRCEWLMREKCVLQELEHPFIVTLHETYADDKNIFLLLGVALGGDLYRLIEKLGQVHEKIARFYAGSLTLALEHMHSREMIYRDLKPENVLLDAQGYVKLCDFGFAKKITDRTYTRCGTPDYTCPEMLLNQGVNQACDWWALGILIFEMLTGVPPFTDPGGDDMQTYQNITHGELSKCYPDSSTATDEARALIRGLCTVKVAYRLGYLKGGANDVMAHAWFAAFDWDGLVNLTVESPWRPSLSSCEDTMCFDEMEGTNSLDGPSSTRAMGAELEAKWTALQAEYAGEGGLNETSHLTA